MIAYRRWSGSEEADISSFRPGLDLPIDYLIRRNSISLPAARAPFVTAAAEAGLRLPIPAKERMRA